jgi:Leucine-rich repeat (LRR) protein
VIELPHGILSQIAGYLRGKDLFNFLQANKKLYHAAKDSVKYLPLWNQSADNLMLGLDGYKKRVVSEISLNGQNLNTLNLTIFDNYPSLRRLILDKCQVSLNGLNSMLSKVPQLKVLCVEEIKIVSDLDASLVGAFSPSNHSLKVMPSVLKDFIQLEELNLSGGEYLAWEMLSTFRKLKVLNIAYCNLSELPYVLKDIPSLEDLDAGFNVIDDNADWKVLSGLHKLKVLSLNFNLMNKLPEELSILSDLEKLNLSENLDLELQERDFDGLKKLHSLKSLNLIDTAIEVRPLLPATIKVLPWDE